MNVCVFCSANEVGEKYVDATKQFAGLLAKDGHHLVYGGANCGLMKVVAEGVKHGGGKVYGYILELFCDTAYKEADEMTVLADLSTRKATMLRHADSIVVLPGGLGTLDEVTEIIEHKRHGLHSCNIIILNTAGFYDGLKTQIERMQAEGFLPVGETAYYSQANGSWVTFVDTPEEAMMAL